MALMQMTADELRKIVENWPWKEKRVIPDELREEYEERAAILEIDGGLSRGEAERRAYEAVVLKKRVG